MCPRVLLLIILLPLLWGWSDGLQFFKEGKIRGRHVAGRTLSILFMIFRREHISLIKQYLKTKCEDRHNDATRKEIKVEINMEGLFLYWELRKRSDWEKRLFMVRDLLR
jgi:hypothetical protein